MSDTLIEAAGLLVLPHLKVQNANAISGPLTWGFPAPTAFTGFAHALERRLSEYLVEGFGGIGIVSHGFEPQTSISAGRTHAFNLTRNPVGKDGQATAFVEEARAHLEVTLIIAVRDELGDSDGQKLAQIAFDLVSGMRLAGGSILPPPSGNRYECYWQTLPEFLDGQRETFKRLRRRLLPGFALVLRDNLLREHLAEMQRQEPANVLDALLDLCRINIEPDESPADESGNVEWRIRKEPGWLVPLPVGYAAISGLYQPGEVANTRDSETPFRFVESLYSVGEWISPHRLKSLQDLLWHTEADTGKGIYRCVNGYEL